MTEFNPKRYDYIDALRGYAVAGVIAIHTPNLVPHVPLPIVWVATTAGQGVQLFFIVSALTLTMSWRKRAINETHPARYFFIRRFFRIAPMFWIGILFYYSLAQFESPFWQLRSIEISDVLATLFFVHGWSPETINLVVPGGWTIAVEMMFYLLFPLLVTTVMTLRGAIFFFVGSCVMALAMNTVASAWYEADPALLFPFIYEWLPNQLPIFALGFLLFYLIADTQYRAPRTAAIVIFSAGIGLLLALTAASWRIPFFSTFPHPMIWKDLLAGAGFVAIAYSLANWPTSVFINRPIRYLGKVSFSAYLVHFLVIFVCLRVFGPSVLSGISAIAAYILLFLSVTLITAAISSVTYSAIEKPMIDRGNQIIESLENLRAVE